VHRSPSRLAAILEPNDGRTRRHRPTSSRESRHEGRGVDRTWSPQKKEVSKWCVMSAGDLLLINTTGATGFTLIPFGREDKE